MDFPDIILAPHQRQALLVRDLLETWCNFNFKRTSDRDIMPEASVTIADYYCDLSIGDITIWDSESGYADEKPSEDHIHHPDFGRCLTSYDFAVKKMIAEITPKGELTDATRNTE